MKRASVILTIALVVMATGCVAHDREFIRQHIVEAPVENENARTGDESVLAVKVDRVPASSATVP